MVSSCCDLCGETSGQNIFSRPTCPAFQHKVYVDRVAALAASVGKVDLIRCPHCGFVWNAAFSPHIMNYDGDYQNEQAYSGVFQYYLKEVLSIISEHVAVGSLVNEVGCGKAHFLDMLRKSGFKVAGYDPAHEGEDPDVTCAYFDERINVEPGAMVVLRHTLEHVPNPLNFLHSIRRANGGAGKIFIEVPCFDWIQRRKAFWDIFHEHCNYFTRQTLAGMFENAEVGHLFNGQYLYVVGDLSELCEVVHIDQNDVAGPVFNEEIARMRAFVGGLNECLVWGAGAKGVAFVNLTDPDMTVVRSLIDINPRKQRSYVPISGHPVAGPDILTEYPHAPVLVMNENYKDEVVEMISSIDHSRRECFSLGEI